MQLDMTSKLETRCLMIFLCNCAETCVYTQTISIKITLKGWSKKERSMVRWNLIDKDMMFTSKVMLRRKIIWFKGWSWLLGERDSVSMVLTHMSGVAISGYHWRNIGSLDRENSWVWHGTWNSLLQTDSVQTGFNCQGSTVYTSRFPRHRTK